MMMNARITMVTLLMMMMMLTNMMIVILTSRLIASRFTDIMTMKIMTNMVNMLTKNNDYVY